MRSPKRGGRVGGKPPQPSRSDEAEFVMPAMLMSDDEAHDCMRLTSALRAWLEVRRESPQVQASAIAYELAALIARIAETEMQAEALVAAWTHVMREQIAAFGVGTEHP